MKKMLLATTALAAVSVTPAIAVADVTITGGVEWRYISVSDDLADDGTARPSNTDFQGSHDITISMSSTTDSGLTLGLSGNIGEGGSGTFVSSISGDFGTIEFTEGSGGAHAASTYDVTSGGVSGGHGDLNFTLYTGAGAEVSTVGLDEAQINDPENGALNYHSPNLAGFQFGVGTSHLGNGDTDSSTSYGLMYSGNTGGMMDDGIGYSIGFAGYDGSGDNVGGSHIGATLTSGKITLGVGSAKNEKSDTSEEEVLSYSTTYKVSDALKLNIGYAMAENNKDSAEATNTSIGLAYTVVPGLTWSLSSHRFEYTEATEANNNEGSAIQSELKMSF